MRGGTKSRGYTIIEVMIFLAISGLMFVIAAIFVSGKQSNAEFSQGMNDINTRIQQVISDVGNGFYPSSSNFSCMGHIGPPNSISFPFGSNVQGTNGGHLGGSNVGCVFMGKAIQIGTDTSSSGYNIFSIAGLQYTDIKNTLPTTYAQAVPTVITASGVTQSETLSWGLKITKMTSGGVNKINAIAFVSSLNGGSVSATQNVVAVPIPGDLSLAESESSMAGDINFTLRGADLSIASNPNPKILVCFDGGRGKYGTLTIGNSTGTSGQRLSTNIQIYSDSAGWVGAGC